MSSFCKFISIFVLCGMIDKNASNTSLLVGYALGYAAARLRRPAARGPAPRPPLPASLSPTPSPKSLWRPIRGIYVHMYTFT
jgi:hypothetical protein